MKLKKQLGDEKIRLRIFEGLRESVEHLNYLKKEG